MTSNSVRARLFFSFQGETQQFDTRIDLDGCASTEGEAPDFHLLLAKANGIDPYSYRYDALESHDIEFSDPTGIAALCCHDGQLEWPRFEQLRREAQDLLAVRMIAEQILRLPDLDSHADLKAALLAAYRAGKTSER